MIFETGLSPNTINFVHMRLVLVFLATFLQSLFNLFNVQNLIGLYALCKIVGSCRFKPMVIAGLATHVQKPCQKMAARSKAASLGKTSVS